MHRGETGTFRITNTTGERVRAFVPHALPPAPPLTLDPIQQSDLEAASLALGRLDGLASQLPDRALFLYSYIRKEAVLSSQIEGMQSSLSDLMLFELDALPGVPLDDAREVSSYVAALEHGIARLRGGMPLSNRLIREMHGVMLAEGRGSGKEPGEFRRSQNWIGGSRPGNAHFVPAPPESVEECMAALERFIHSDEPLPVLVRAALTHVQFETIHPFLDGNGRVGRLLITLMLVDAGLMHEPMLYLSLHLKSNRAEYYALLDRVRRDGDWEAWIGFFLRGVRETAEGAIVTAQRLTALAEEDRLRLVALGRTAHSALRVHEALKARPINSIARLSQMSARSFPATAKAMGLLEDLGIARELTGRKRNRLFAYDRYLSVLSEGGEPLR